MRPHVSNRSELRTEIIYVLNLHHDQPNTSGVRSSKVLVEGKRLLFALVSRKSEVDGGVGVLQQPFANVFLLVQAGPSGPTDRAPPMAFHTLTGCTDYINVQLSVCK